MNRYHHLSHQEPAILMIGLESGKNLRQISNLLDRSPSTLSRELKRNSMTVKSYNASKASDAYYERRLLSVNIERYLSLLRNKPYHKILIIKDKLASRRGFEPPTCRLGGGCSIQLSYRDIIEFYY